MMPVRLFSSKPDKQGKRPWTPYEIKRARELRDAGKGATDIGKELGRSRGSVQAFFSAEPH